MGGPIRTLPLVRVTGAVSYTHLIVIGSVSLIYNAFAISVSERSRQFGMLSGVGATSRQIRRTVFFEAFVVGALGIPLGIGAGIGGIGITLYCLRDSLCLLYTSRCV